MSPAVGDTEGKSPIATDPTAARKAADNPQRTRINEARVSRHESFLPPPGEEEFVLSSQQDENTHPLLTDPIPELLFACKQAKQLIDTLETCASLAEVPKYWFQDINKVYSRLHHTLNLIRRSTGISMSGFTEEQVKKNVTTAIKLKQDIKAAVRSIKLDPTPVPEVSLLTIPEIDEDDGEATPLRARRNSSPSLPSRPQFPPVPSLDAHHVLPTSTQESMIAFPPSQTPHMEESQQPQFPSLNQPHTSLPSPSPMPPPFKEFTSDILREDYSRITGEQLPPLAPEQECPAVPNRLELKMMSTEFFTIPVMASRVDYLDWLASQTLCMLGEGRPQGIDNSTLSVFLNKFVSNAKKSVPNVSVSVTDSKYSRQPTAGPSSRAPFGNWSRETDASGLFTRFRTASVEDIVDEEMVYSPATKPNFYKPAASFQESIQLHSQQAQTAQPQTADAQMKSADVHPRVTEILNKGKNREGQYAHPMPPIPPITKPDQTSPNKRKPNPRQPRPLTPVSTLKKVQESFPKESYEKHLEITQNLMNDNKAQGPKTPPAQKSYANAAKPSNTSTPNNKPFSTTPKEHGWTEVKKNEYKPTNKSTNKRQLHLRSGSTRFENIEHLTGVPLVKAINDMIPLHSDVPVGDQQWRITDARFTIRNDLILSFDTDVNLALASIVINAIAAMANCDLDDLTYLNRTATSCFKFNGVPTILWDGTNVQENTLELELRAHQAWASVEFKQPPKFITPKGQTKGVTSTVFVEVVDDDSGSIGKKLMNTTVCLAGGRQRTKVWIRNRDTPQCSNCLKWGHGFFACRSNNPYCSRCGGPHPWRLHKQVCNHCKEGNHCTIKCINCDGNHSALDQTCHFYINRNNASVMRDLVAQKVQRDRQRRVRSIQASTIANAAPAAANIHVVSPTAPTI